MAGAESNTSIAFGYFAESYIDFGLPVMYLPIFFSDCSPAFVSDDLPASLPPRTGGRGDDRRLLVLALSFERSWDRILGIGLTLMIVITFTLVLAERLFGRIPKGQ